jgi:tetratricopeptide (TPR) repeat protein
MSHYFWRIGDLTRAIESGQRALAVADSIGDFALQTTNVNVALAYYGVGDYARAIDCLRWILAALPPERVHERFGWAGLPAVTARAYLTTCLTERGEFAEGLIHGLEAVRIAETVDHPFSLGQGLISVGGLHLRQGDLERAMPVLARGLELSRLADVPALFAGSASALGFAWALAGRVEEGAKLLEQGVAEAAARKITARQSLWLSWLSEVNVLANRLDEAGALATQALELSRAHGTRGNLAYALRARAEAVRRTGPAGEREAESLFQQSIALAEELGMRPLEAQARLGLGELYGSINRPPDARVQLQRSVALFRTLDMGRHLARAEAELARSERAG